MGRCLGVAKPVAQWYDNLRKMVNFFPLNRDSVAGSKGHGSDGKRPPEKGFAHKGEEIQQTTLGVELNISAGY